MVATAAPEEVRLRPLGALAAALISGGLGPKAGEWEWGTLGAAPRNPAQGRRAKTADLAFPLAAFPPYPIPFPTSRGRKGEPCAGRGASLHPARSLNGFLIYVSGQLARNFWDPGKASIVFASNSSRSGTGRAVQFGGSRDKTWDHFTISLLGFLQG